MNISLDFDDTYTLDPEFWNNFIDLCYSQGHDVYCVTLRYEYEGDAVFRTIGKMLDKNKIIFAGRKAKFDVCQKRGIFIDVWIDDMPWFVSMNEKH